MWKVLIFFFIFITGSSNLSTELRIWFSFTFVKQSLTFRSLCVINYCENIVDITPNIVTNLFLYFKILCIANRYSILGLCGDLQGHPRDLSWYVPVFLYRLWPFCYSSRCSDSRACAPRRLLILYVELPLGPVYHTRHRLRRVWRPCSRCVLYILGRDPLYWWKYWWSRGLLDNNFRASLGRSFGDRACVHCLYLDLSSFRQQRSSSGLAASLELY